MLHSARPLILPARACVCRRHPGLRASPATPTAQQSAHDRLFQLFKDSDEASLKRNPFQALARGDLRYADRLGDLFSDAHYRGEKAADEQDLAALHTIPRDQLNATDQIAYDVFDYTTSDALRGLQPQLLMLTEALPMNHFYGLHTEYPTIASGQGGAPYNTLLDYENSLKRNRDFATNIDEAIVSMAQGRGGRRSRYQAHRPQHDRATRQPVEADAREIAYWGPIKSFPAVIGPADRARLTKEYRESITTVIYPALTRLRGFCRTNICATPATASDSCT